MHNPYIHDLFTEGLGDIFFMKYYKFLKSKIKNKRLRNTLIYLHVIIYLFFLLMVAFIIFKLSFPL